MNDNPFSEIRTFGSYRQLFELLLFTLAMSVVLSAGGTLLLNKLLGLGVAFEEIYILTQGLVACGACLMVLKEQGVEAGPALRSWRAGAARDALAALGYFAVYLLIIAVLLAAAHSASSLFPAPRAALVLERLDPQAARDAALRAVMGVSAPRFLFMLFGICALTPLAEELLYRRLVYTTLRRRMGFLKALFASSVIFAAVHTTASLAVFPVGLLLGYVYEKKRRLPVNIALHALINLFATAARVFL